MYDTYSGAVIDNLDSACTQGRDMRNQLYTMKPHPVDEDVLVCCFDGGIHVLYDVRQLRVIQEIVEHGIYAIDQYQMNSAVDVDWSPDGNYIAFSSVLGTISLYSTMPHKQAQYMATRVQQFFPYDDEMHDSNIFETLGRQPQLCGYELNPYEVQPNPPTIGKYSKGAQPPTAEEFQKQQIFAREFAVEEERFYQDQLREGLRLGHYDTQNESGEAERDAGPNQLQRLLSYNDRPDVAMQDEGAVGAPMDAEMFAGSDDDLLGGASHMRGGRTSNRRGGRGRLLRADELPEAVDSSQDEEEFVEGESDSEDGGGGGSQDGDGGFGNGFAANSRAPLRQNEFLEPRSQPQRSR